MRLTLIIYLLMLVILSGSAEAYPSLPQFSFAAEKSDFYGLVVNPRYANLLTDTSALGLEIGFGAREFRLGGTLSSLLFYNQCLKFTAEYLSQQNQFNFLEGTQLLWNEQHTFAAGYAYLLKNAPISSFNLGIYEGGSRDENLSPIYHVADDIDILYRNIKGATLYGGNAGVSLQPLLFTKINLDLYMDVINYRNIAEAQPSKGGLGYGINVEQILHPRFLLTLNAVRREIYDQYNVKLSWLILNHLCSRLELSLLGQYVAGNLPQPKETRVGLMLTYRWNNSSGVFDYSRAPSLQEYILTAATRPLIRMPRTFVARDQKIVLLPRL
ncbi:MAG: hypothetical protein H0U71_00710 [Gammaproteobacteria bacterium]|nr:hypothetical protein [Gammaproteobacteria bacterium]